LTELTPSEVGDTIVTPAISAEKLVDHMKKFNELKSKLLDKEDVVSIQGKPFVRRSGWRKIALAFNISDGKVVALKASGMEEKQFKEFMNLLSWTIKKLANCPDQDFSILTRDLK